MDFTDFTTQKDDDQRRIDKIIRKFLKDTPLSTIYKSIRKGLVKVNNKKIKEDYVVTSGDIINIASFLLNKSIDSTQSNTNNINEFNTTQFINENLIYKNEHLLVLNKPYDFLVQKADNNQLSLDTIVKNYYNLNLKKESLSFNPGPLHRLDRNTTGLITFSLSLEGARWFSKNIQTHSITKIYRGIIQGKLLNKEIWNDKITKTYDNQKKFQTVDVSFSKDEANSFTEVIPLKYGKIKNIDFTYVEFIIHSGKTHQIRAQSSLHNFPLLSDEVYGAKKINLNKKYFLHAYKLIFPENLLFEIPQEIIAPLPLDFKEIIQ